MQTRTSIVVYLTALIIGASVMVASRAAEEPARSAGPYVPTPQAIVDHMLLMAQVNAKDVVVDLGSGDGRLVRTAAKNFGAAGFGVDIDGELVDRSNELAKSEGVANRVRFLQQDIFKADIRKASVVTLYILPEMMINIRAKLLSELRPGTRIVSHDYHFRDWIPDARDSFENEEKKEAIGFSSVSLYLWVVPATVSGRWRLEVPDAKLGEPLTLEFAQTFQNINGKALVGARGADVANAKLRADAIEFALDPAAKPNGYRYTFKGRVVGGDRMEGRVTWGTSATAKRLNWHAVRIPGSGDAAVK